MRITIINGFFLPLPPVRGGATEKSWFRLAGEFARAGHDVVCVSRRWPGFPDDETIAGVRHLRLRGHDHRRSLPANLALDFLWSQRVHRALPPADIVVCHAVTLPAWLGRLKPRAGKVVVMCGRMPKGQYRLYSRLARVLAPSGFVRERILAENPGLAPQVRVTGYPIDWDQFQDPAPARTPPPSGEVTIGFIGRLHEEKGLRLLAAALGKLRQTPGLPPWRVVIRGPAGVAQGGSGPEFRAELSRLLEAAVGSRFQLLEPQFDEAALAAAYRELDIFCYPSLAAEGETFGVAVAEAMAAGAAPVVSALPCFRDFVHAGKNGLVFDQTAPDAAGRLAASLECLVRDAALRRRLADAARADSARFGFTRYATALLEDFAQLTSG